jgi:hypothetical protein
VETTGLQLKDLDSLKQKVFLLMKEAIEQHSHFGTAVKNESQRIM